MYRNHWVTSDLQFRKEALIPPFLVGLGWADSKHTSATTLLIAYGITIND
jgi:hypothetical protein